MSVVGIDVGFTATGIVHIKSKNEIDSWHIVRTAPLKNKKSVAINDAKRCETLAIGIAKIIIKCKPKYAFLELPTGGAQGARPHRCMGMSTAITISVLRMLKVKYYVVTPRDVKNIVGKKGSVSKLDVQEVVTKKFVWKTLPKRKADFEHVADAAGAVFSVMKKRGIV